MAKFENVPIYQATAIEHRVRQLLTDTFGEPLELPIDVEIILESMPGVFFDIWPHLKENHCVEGMVCRDTLTGELCVFVNQELADDYRYHSRYRMTVAEELAHVILHREIIEQVTSPEDFVEIQRSRHWHAMDRNAKRYAAATLMPGDSVRKSARALYPRLVAIAGYRNSSAILGTMTAKLAEDFMVSQQAMRIRLKEWPVNVEASVIQAMKDELDYF